MVDQRDVDRFGRVLHIEDRIALPVNAGDIAAVEFNFLVDRAAGGLHDLRFECLPQQIGRDHLTAVVCDEVALDPDAVSFSVDLDFGHHRHARCAAHRIGKALPAVDIALLFFTCADVRLPASLGGDRFDRRQIARVRQIAQTKFNGVGVGRQRQFVHERFRGEMDLRATRIAEVRGAQGRGAIEQRRDGVGSFAPRCERIGFTGHSKQPYRF